LRGLEYGRTFVVKTGFRLHALAGLVFVAVLLPAGTAVAYERAPLLEQVASHFAHRPAEVHCPSMPEWNNDPIWGSDPHPQRAWGYTDMVRDFIVMQPLLCAGAIAITDTKLPSWQRATGALVLVHEAYHVRLWKSRWSEAKVECQAIRHFEEGAELLGASVQIANDLLPYALAAHARMVRLYPSYRQPRCRLPLWAVPMTP
jgi:hypothetical protein